VDTAQSIARISVVGVSGAGRSTVARMAAARLGVPCIELDAIHHGPNWTEIPISELRRIVTELVAGETWVIDGNYRKVRDLIWGASDDGGVGRSFQIGCDGTGPLAVISASRHKAGVVAWQSRAHLQMDRSRTPHQVGVEDV
jgi:hypothetical protein